MPVKNSKALDLYETLEIDELVDFQTNGLIKLKEAANKIKDPEFEKLYKENIQNLEINISELIHDTILYLYTQSNQ